MSDFEGFDLDQSTARAWTQLQDRLAEHLATMDDGENLVIDVEANGDDESDGAYPYVQFAVGDEEVVFEVSSNDAIHLAAAVATAELLVTADQSLLVAAQSVGLSVADVAA